MKRLLKVTALFTALAVLAEDVTTADGKVYRDATLTRAEEDQVVLKHSGGEIRLPVWELPEAVRARFQFDPIAALRRQSERLRQLEEALASARGETRLVQTQLIEVVKPRRPDLWTNQPPTLPAVQLPPLKAGETVKVFDLMNHYRADGTSADSRYRRHEFVVEGIILRLDDHVVGRDVDIVLETPDPVFPLLVRWTVPAAYDTFRTRNAGRHFSAPGNKRAPTLTLLAGEKVRFKVRGGGVEDGAVVLTKAELLP